MRGYAAIALDRCKDRANLGGVLRAAGCFEASLVLVGGSRLGKYAADTMKAYKHLPCMEVENIMDSIPFKAIPVAVEITDNARNICNFIHPENALYIFGPEDGTISKEILSRVPIIIKIPSTRCLNLAASVNIILYDRMCKQDRSGNRLNTSISKA